MKSDAIGVDDVMKFLIKAKHTQKAKDALDRLEEEFNRDFDSAVENHPIAKKTKFVSPISVRIMIYEVTEGYSLIITMSIPKTLMIILSLKGVLKKNIEKYLEQSGIEYESVKLISGGM